VLDGRVYVGTGFSFFAYAIDEPLAGGLSVFSVP
jgi:hypothetical protein